MVDLYDLNWCGLIEAFLNAVGGSKEEWRLSFLRHGVVLSL